MTNDSSTGGYILPELSPPAPTPQVEDITLDTFLQAIVVGITGLPGTLVWPRWQSINPKMPEATVDWASIGVMSETPEYAGSLLHYSKGINGVDPNGYDEYQRQTKLEIMCSFYGPNSRMNSNLLRDGLFIPQNREVLFLNHMQLVSTDCRIISTNELLNQVWFRRCDITFYVRVAYDRFYPILNILEAVGIVQTADKIGLKDSFDTGTNPNIPPGHPE